MLSAQISENPTFNNVILEHVPAYQAYFIMKQPGADGGEQHKLKDVAQVATINTIGHIFEGSSELYNFRSGLWGYNCTCVAHQF